MFGAGCFWGVEAAFLEIEDVTKVTSGYSGGETENPTYEEVCSGMTGHAEVVQIEYDPEKVSYEELLDVFWKCHDPTTLNRQGPDIGTQYRSAIFFHTPEQEETANASMQIVAENGFRKDPIVTQIYAAKPFYRAEEYHQRYYEKHGINYCPV